MSDQKLLIGYYRLSREDDNAGDSNSIINQRKLVKDYISHMSDLEEMSFQEFYDDGYSGSSMDRPGIKKVLAYICLHAASCLTVMCYVKIFHIIPAHNASGKPQWLSQQQQ